ncbi:hypothetical protein niasHS_007859 [Heterodera schachtii]|uniref:Uncharacterized protein n=1 Tax=Heterodera schachtii TaxID=97005 RepID=A0ABD2JQ26_HETSC
MANALECWHGVQNVTAKTSNIPMKSVALQEKCPDQLNNCAKTDCKCKGKNSILYSTHMTCMSDKECREGSFANETGSCTNYCCQGDLCNGVVRTVHTFGTGNSMILSALIGILTGIAILD